MRQEEKDEQACGSSKKQELRPASPWSAEVDLSQRRGQRGRERAPQGTLVRSAVQSRIGRHLEELGLCSLSRSKDGLERPM